MAGPHELRTDLLYRRRLWSLLLLRAEQRRVRNLPDVQDKLIELGLVPFTNSPADYAAMIKADRDRYATIIKQVGVKLE